MIKNTNSSIHTLILEAVLNKKKLLNKVLIVSFILLVTQPYAYAIKWEKVGKNNKGDIFYIEIESISKNKNLLSFYSKISKEKEASKNLTKFKLVLNCSNETFALYEVLQYAANGKIIKKEVSKNPTFEKFPQGSLIEGLYKNFCSPE